MSINKPIDAGAPFDSLHADVILRSSDNIDFRTFKLLLSLASPFFEGMFEMHHLPMPSNLQANISYHYYEAGHMVYVNEQVLKQFHDDVASFVRDSTAAK